MDNLFESVIDFFRKRIAINGKVTYEDISFLNELLREIGNSTINREVGYVSVEATIHHNKIRINYWPPEYYINHYDSKNYPPKHCDLTWGKLNETTNDIG